MQDELRKIAKVLREKAKKDKDKKTVKCAQVAVASTGLALMRRKIGG